MAKPNSDVAQTRREPGTEGAVGIPVKDDEAARGYFEEEPMTDRPPFPQGCPRQFRATVHGTVFAGRDRHVDRMNEGDVLYLIPDPPGQEDPEVWVHLAGGDPIGHLPSEIGAWLAPWILKGGGASAKALKVHGAEVPSWRRVLLEVSCAG